MDPAEHVRVILSYCKRQRYSWEDSWERAIASIPRLPHDAPGEAKGERKEWWSALTDPAVEFAFRRAYMNGVDPGELCTPPWLVGGVPAPIPPVDVPAAA